MSNLKTKKAFSLIELMVVMGVVAVLATLSVVAIQLVQRSLRDTERRNVVNTLVLAITELQSNNRNVPVAASTIRFYQTNAAPSSTASDIYYDTDGGAATNGRRIYGDPSLTGNLKAALRLDFTSDSNPAESSRFSYAHNNVTFVVCTVLESGGDYFNGPGIGNTTLQNACATQAKANSTVDTINGVTV